MKKLIINIWTLIKKRGNGDVIFLQQGITKGAVVVAICNKHDGSIWAMERSISDAEERRKRCQWAKENTYLTWLKIGAFSGTIALDSRHGIGSQQ